MDHAGFHQLAPLRLTHIEIEASENGTTEAAVLVELGLKWILVNIKWVDKKEFSIKLKSGSKT